MAQFDEAKTGEFLGVVRKYMQVRGSLSQKDLSEMAGVGVSTMSRFLNQKTTELNPQLIAKIVAKLSGMRDNPAARFAFFAVCKSTGISNANAATLFINADNTAPTPPMMAICAPSPRELSTSARVISAK